MRKFISLFLTLLTLSVGQMWGAEDDEHVYYFTNATTYAASKADGWGIDNDYTNSFNSSKGAAWLRNNCGKAPTFTFTPDYPVKQVIVRVGHTSGTGKTNITISVGEEEWKSWTDLNTQALTNYSSDEESPSNEEIEIATSFSNCSGSSRGSFCVYSITLVEGGSSSCANKVTLATGNPSNGTISFSPTGPVETCDGSVDVTMTITPNAGYYLSAYTTGDGSVSTSNSPSITTGTSATATQTPTLTFGTNTNGTYTANATFTAFVDHFIDNIQETSGFTGEGKAKSGDYSASASLAELTLDEGDKTTGSNCRKEHYHFCGWVTEEFKDNPHGHLATITGTATGTTYYAVWAKEGTGGTSYTKVTSISEGVYVMVSEKTSNTFRYMPNTTSSGSNPALGSGITMSTTAGVTTLTNAVTDAMLWDFTLKSGSVYYIRPHGSTTIGLGTTNSTGANIRISDTYKNMEWTIATSNDYGWQFKNNSSTNMYLAVYDDSNWRNYSSSSTNQNGTFYLFKQTRSYTDSISICCQELGSINGSFLGTTHFGALSPEKFRPERP